MSTEQKDPNKLYPTTPAKVIQQVTEEIAQGDPGDEQSEVPTAPSPEPSADLAPGVGTSPISSNQGSNFKS